MKYLQKNPIGKDQELYGINSLPFISLFTEHYWYHT